MKTKIIGGIILLVVIIAIILFQFFNSNKPEQITVTGYLGGEKVGLMEDEEVKKILKDKYGLTVEYTKAGSIEMIEQDSSDKDYLFPSSQTALELKEMVLNKTGKQLKIDSRLEYDDLINDYKVNNISCHVQGFDGLIEGVLKVAQIMSSNIKPDLYNLNKLFDE